MENSSLSDLIELARDPDPAARQALSQRITDICLRAPRQLNADEKEVAGHILIRLSREFETQVRAGLARQLAASPRAPKLLFRPLLRMRFLFPRPLSVKAPCWTNVI